MKLLSHFLVIISICFPFLTYGQLNVSVYRNDGLFNNFRMIEGDSITHFKQNDTMFMVIKDFISGETHVPLSAIDSLMIHSSDIPVLRISLLDFPEVTSLWDKERYLDAKLSIEGNGYTDDQDSLSLQIKGRGNSTWGMPKKPMRLKFSKKTSICGCKKAKNFVLLNNYIDPSLMRNALAMWLAKRLGVPYANTIVPCHVFINGSYAGAYTLTEKIGINSGSVDIDENQGILLELSTEFDEKYKFRSSRWNLPVMVKDPDFDELYEDNPDGVNPEGRMALWKDDFNTAEQLIGEGKVGEAFDIESAVNYLLLYHFMGNPELSHPKSLYIHKENLTKVEKYYFGPAWDFDFACNFKYPANDAFMIHLPTAPFEIPSFIREIFNCAEFKERYKERVREFQEEIYPEFLTYFDSYAKLIESSAKLNGLRWKNCENLSWIIVEPSFDRAIHVPALRQWLVDRAEYLTTSVLN